MEYDSPQFQGITPVELTSPDNTRNFCFFAERGWRHALELAYIYGWRPSGTKAPRIRGRLASDSCEDWDWPEPSFFKRYPHVTSAEAAEIAHALTKALPDLPSHHCLEDYVQCWDGQLRENIPLTEWFSHAGKESLRAFISFCLEGEFEISPLVSGDST